MKSIEDLKAMMAEIEKAPPCPTHGRARLEICTEPNCHNVYCMGVGGSCGSVCQCSNDE